MIRNVYAPTRAGIAIPQHEIINIRRRDVLSRNKHRVYEDIGEIRVRDKLIMAYVLFQEFNCIV